MALSASMTAHPSHFLDRISRLNKPSRSSSEMLFSRYSTLVTASSRLQRLSSSSASSLTALPRNLVTSSLACTHCSRSIHTKPKSTSTTASSFTGPPRRSLTSYLRSFKLPLRSIRSLPSRSSLNFTALSSSLPTLPTLPLYISNRLPNVRENAGAMMAYLQQQRLRRRRSDSSSADTDLDLPQLTYAPTPYNESIISSTPSLSLPYTPTPWMRSSHSQTILGTLLRFRPSIIYNREVLQLSDGGQIALDWDSGVNAKSKVQFDTEGFTLPTPSMPSSSTQPILLLFPGLTGGSRSKYLCQQILLARSYNWKAVVFNFRGVLIPFTTPKPSTGICTQDVREALAHIHACYPNAPKVCVSFSMGANILVRTLGLLGEEGVDLKQRYGLISASAVSCAFDFVKLVKSLHTPVNQLLYSRFLTYQLKRNYLKQAHVQAMSSNFATINMKHALDAQTILEFDERFTMHLYEYRDVMKYYQDQSCAGKVKHINLPLLCLNALDDPFEGEIPYASIKENKNVLLATTRRGGHVAWTRGWNPLAKGSSWMMMVTMEYLDATLKLHQREQQQQKKETANDSPATPPQ